MAEALGIAAPGRAAFFPVELRGMADGRFRVRTVYTGLSAGTELASFKGTSPFLEAGWDPEYGVFRRDRPAEAYPIERLGYMEVGRVTESRHAGVPEGRLVAMTYGHKTEHVADPASERFVLLPEDLDPLLGIYAIHMGPICANGLLHAAAEVARGGEVALGDGVRDRHVLVVGAGVVGLLVASFAAHLGAAEVVVADVTPARLRTARALGFDALDDGDGDGWKTLKDRWHHGPNDRGADVVFQCRGQAGALASALRCLRPQRSVIDLAFYAGGADELRLGEEFHHNGLTIRCAQIGRVPLGLADTWNRDRLSQETLDLLQARGAAIREHLITDVVPLAEAPALLEALAARRRHVIQAVFAVDGDAA
jgi:threonine dehydrogenase-like Zn-dependent dehydrogenase